MRRFRDALLIVAATWLGSVPLAQAAPPTATGNPPVYDTGGQGKSQAGATSVIGLENGTGAQCLVGSDSTCDLLIAGSFSASLGGFTPSASGARMTPLSVTTSDSSGNLPTGAVAVVFNTDTTNPIYCNVNEIAATIGDAKIPANSWFPFTIPAGTTHLHCIATGGTVLANGLGGSGLPTGAGGGGGSGGGGGGNVSITSPVDGSGYVNVDVQAGSLTGTLSPAGATSTDASGTVTTGTTYQTLQASTVGRKGCLIQNTSLHSESVKYNTTIVYLAPGSGSGDTFSPGSSFSCWTGIIVVTDQIQITSPTTGASFSAAFQ